MNKQKGFSSLVILIALLTVAIVFALYMARSNRGASMDLPVVTMPQEQATQDDYDTLGADTETPEEINNAAIQDLDALMQGVDSSPNEDLTDIVSY